MSRAFVSERDGSFCTEKMRECVWADENGKCPLTECRQEPERPDPADTQVKSEFGAGLKEGQHGDDRR